MKPVFTSLLLLAVLGQSACNMINPAEKIPTYIQIDSIQVIPTVPSVHGSTSHKITDVWVYYNLELLGAFELPAKVPVLADGKGQLQILAGIWDNGLSGTRAKYPFYNIDTFSFQANPTGVISHIPKFTYRTTDTPAIKYFVENFEQGNIFVGHFGDTTLTKTNNPSDVFEGDWSARMDLSSTDPTGESITSTEYFLTPNRECYMELNYKSDVPFDIRTQVYHVGTNITSDIMSFKARDTWTKVYINLTGFAASFQYGKFRFIVKSVLPSGMTQGKILIDNFKIIYYQ